MYMLIILLKFDNVFNMFTSNNNNWFLVSNTKMMNNLYFLLVQHCIYELLLGWLIQYKGPFSIMCNSLKCQVRIQPTNGLQVTLNVQWRMKGLRKLKKLTNFHNFHIVVRSAGWFKVYNLLCMANGCWFYVTSW